MFDAEYRNLVGNKVPTTIDRAWVTMVRCKACKHKMVSDGKIMWCETCYEKMIQDTIDAVEGDHEKRLVYAFYYGSITNMMSLVGMTIFNLAHHIIALRKEKGYDIPTRDEIKRRLVVKIN